ncbi:MAG: hypothetical protein ACO3DK_03770 [Bacteroidia bacterium]
MDTGLLHLHNLLRWVIVVTLIWSLWNAFKGKNGKETLIMMISAHITLLVGLYQWATGGLGLANMGAMSNSAARFWAIEHPTMMILSILFITLGHRSAKADDTAKTKRWLFIALVLILLAMPWPFREAIGRPWFPGMH